MKQDLVTSIFAAVVGALVAYFVCGMFLPSFDDMSVTIPKLAAEESFSFIDPYTLNDYFLARGFANIYVSGVGTAGSNGFMTSGDYAQVESFKAVIDWLNGRAVAFSSHRRDQKVLADWSSGLVCTTGKSYLGTMSTALATTGVEGLKGRRRPWCHQRYRRGVRLGLQEPARCREAGRYQ